jgi:hypothetical protein
MRDIVAVTDLQLSRSRLPPSPDDSGCALWLGCEGVYRYPCATTSTGYRPGANVANIFNPLTMPSERVAPDDRFIGSFRYVCVCKGHKIQGLFLAHVSAAVLLTCRVYGVAKLRISTHWSAIGTTLKDENTIHCFIVYLNFQMLCQDNNLPNFSRWSYGRRNEMVWSRNWTKQSAKSSSW